MLTVASVLELAPNATERSCAALAETPNAIEFVFSALLLKPNATAPTAPSEVEDCTPIARELPPDATEPSPAATSA